MRKDAQRRLRSDVAALVGLPTGEGKRGSCAGPVQREWGGVGGVRADRLVRGAGVRRRDHAERRARRSAVAMIPEYFLAV